jgi:hypothetical protein
VNADRTSARGVSGSIETECGKALAAALLSKCGTVIVAAPTVWRDPLRLVYGQRTHFFGWLLRRLVDCLIQTANTMYLYMKGHMVLLAIVCACVRAHPALICGHA